jgi:hypothetical protein
MKRLVISAVILAASVTSVPLAAQSNYNNGRYENQQHHGWNSNAFWQGAPRGTWERISFLQRRIDRGARDGSLTRKEAKRANAELRQIRYDAQRLRGHNGWYRANSEQVIQRRLDDLSRNLRWARHNQSWQTAAYGYGNDYDRYRTDYDATHYYRDGPQYRERQLTYQDEVYRGSDGRYYCKRNDGTTGLIIGGIAGGVAGNVIDGGSNRVAGTLIGGALGALIGKEVDQNSSDYRCR